jgi:hypothetical protein
MSAEITTIVNGIKARIAISLSSYTEANHQILPENNSEGEFTKAYAVIPKGIRILTGGLLGASTVEQNFEIKLMQQYNSSQIDDSSKRSVALSLLEDDVFTLYNDLVKNRAGAASTVINIGHDMTTNDPEFLVDNNLCVITINLNIVFRKQL